MQDELEKQREFLDTGDHNKRLMVSPEPGGGQNPRPLTARAIQLSPTSLEEDTTRTRSVTIACITSPVLYYISGVSVVTICLNIHTNFVSVATNCDCCKSQKSGDRVEEEELWVAVVVYLHWLLPVPVCCGCGVLDDSGGGWRVWSKEIGPVAILVLYVHRRIHLPLPTHQGQFLIFTK